jgi:hypothetical protein
VIKRIYKYPLTIDDVQHVVMPDGAKILAIQIQNNILCIWAMVAPGNPPRKRSFFMFVTGQDLPDIIDGLEYLTTFQTHDGRFVFHVYEGAA